MSSRRDFIQYLSNILKPEENINIEYDYTNLKVKFKTRFENLINVLDTKQDKFVSGVNIKTINNNSLLGSGNINVDKSFIGLSNVDNTSDLDKPLSLAAIDELNKKQDTLVDGVNIKRINTYSLLGSGNLELTKADIGLSNVDNTSDLNKPLSTSAINALGNKQNTLINGENIKTLNGYNLLGNGELILTKTDIGLGNVDNTSDLEKALSIECINALATKQDTLTSGLDIKTLHGNSILGSGNIVLSKTDIGLSNVDNTGDLNKPLSTSQIDALAQKQNVFVSGVNIKTIATKSVLGSGDLNLTKADFGLGNVDNTSDLNKPVSTAQLAALNAKQNTLSSGTNIKTINTYSVLGAGDLSLTKADIGLSNVDNTSDLNKPISTAAQNSLNLKQDKLISGNNIKTVNTYTLLGAGNLALTKADIGLSNVDNTSDLNKPISTAQQTALNAKQAKLVSGTNIKSINNVSLLGSGNIEITKATVGLSNVDNTSDLNKPISTLQQTALNGKQDKLFSNIYDYTNDSLEDYVYDALNNILLPNTFEENEHYKIETIDSKKKLRITKKLGDISIHSLSITMRMTQSFQTGVSNFRLYRDNNNGTIDLIQENLNIDISDANNLEYVVEMKTPFLLSSANCTFYVTGEAQPNNGGWFTMSYRKITTKIIVGNIKTIGLNTLLGAGDVTLDKTLLGLGNVDNTSDLNKPVSTLQQVELNKKQDKLVSGTNIKTINNTTLLGTGNINLVSGLAFPGAIVLSYVNRVKWITDMNVVVANLTNNAGTTTTWSPLTMPNMSVTNKITMTNNNREMNVLNSTSCLYFERFRITCTSTTTLANQVAQFRLLLNDYEIASSNVYNLTQNATTTKILDAGPLYIAKSSMNVFRLESGATGPLTSPQGITSVRIELVLFNDQTMVRNSSSCRGQMIRINNPIYTNIYNLIGRDFSPVNLTDYFYLPNLTANIPNINFIYCIVDS